MYVEINIEDGVFDRKIPTKIVAEIGSRSLRFYAPKRGETYLYEFDIFLEGIVRNALRQYVIENGEIRGNTVLSRKMKELPKGPLELSNYLYKKYLNNEITIEVNFDGVPTNLKSLKPFETEIQPTNDFLLTKGLCKKVSKPPISWIEV